MYPHLHNIHRLQEQQLRIDSQQNNRIPVLAKLCTKNIHLCRKQKSSLRGRTSVAKVSDQQHFNSTLPCDAKKKRGGPQCTFSLVTVAQVFTSSSTPTILKKQKTFIEHLFLSNSYTGVYLLMMQPV